MLTLEYGHNTIDPVPLNDFFSSYEAFWGSRVAETWQPATAGMLAGPQARFGFRFVSAEEGMGMVAASNVLYGWARAKRDFTFTNNTGHELIVQTNNYGWDFHLGLGNRQWYVVGLMTAHTRDLTLDLYTTLPDGSRTLSNLYKIAGVYTGLATTFDVGLGAGVSLGGWMLTAKLENPLANFPPARYLITTIDYEATDEVLAELPRDFALWATDPVAYAEALIPEDQEVAVLTDHFSGLRVSVGVEIPLTQNRD